MEFYERVSGARLHSRFIRPGGISHDSPLGSIEDVASFINQFYVRIDELNDILSSNRI